jgi:hypothetical protein
MFRILDTLDGFPVSWTLGAILLHVMESIPHTNNIGTHHTGNPMKKVIFFIFIIITVLSSFAYIVYKNTRKRTRYVTVRNDNFDAFLDIPMDSMQGYMYSKHH